MDTPCQGGLVALPANIGLGYEGNDTLVIYANMSLPSIFSLPECL
jgi:hypothetical protein